MSNLEQLVARGIDNNIVCYDDKYKRRKFTWHLYTVMCTVMTKIYHDELMEVYIEPSVKNMTKVQYVNCKLQKGITDIFHRDKEAVLPAGKHSCILGVGKNGSVILGAC